MARKTRAERETLPTEERSNRAKIERKGNPTRSEVSHIMDVTEEDTVKWLLDEGVLNIPVCPIAGCGRYCKRRPGTWNYRCKKHNFQRSLFHETIFSQCKIPIQKALEVLYYWCLGVAHEQVSFFPFLTVYLFFEYFVH